MKAVAVFLLVKLLNLCHGIAINPEIKTDVSRSIYDEKVHAAFLNRDHIRRKRYLGLSKKFKLNKRYQECIGPGDVKGHCKHIAYCPTSIFQQLNTLDFLCVIEESFVGVCCPDDIASAGVVGSQLIIDLPAGGDDYDEGDKYTGCGLAVEGRTKVATKTTSIQEWPWMAALYRYKQLKQGLENQFCGGALITDTHILTAAHCTHGLQASEIRVRLGEYDFFRQDESRSKDYEVAEIIDHEYFVLPTYENDISILRLKTATSFNSYIWPICMPPRDGDYTNETVVVAGWGQQYFAGPVSPVLLQVAIPVWPLDKCMDSFVQKITDDNICAAAYEGGKDSCLGDSGGPLMYKLKNGRWITIGIVSWGIGCGNKDSPGIYTKVGNYLPWIIKHTMAKKIVT
ncbi:venom protease-like [Diabrotica undecimpunctata]|uniref:venom protease-like n=1 Tax=Diabrotica undecimpunctata TaxID=50387 RepID=UPI003B63F091